MQHFFPAPPQSLTFIKLDQQTDSWVAEASMGTREEWLNQISFDFILHRKCKNDLRLLHFQTNKTPDRQTDGERKGDHNKPSVIISRHKSENSPRNDHLVGLLPPLLLSVA